MFDPVQAVLHPLLQVTQGEHSVTLVQFAQLVQLSQQGEKLLAGHATPCPVPLSYILVLHGPPPTPPPTTLI